MTTSMEHIRTTCPRDCYDTCGIMVVKQNDKIAYVRGDPEHPVNRGKLCVKCSIGYNAGTISLLAYLFPLRFFFRLGATEVDPDTICNKAGQVALTYVYVKKGGQWKIVSAHFSPLPNH